MKPLRVIIVGGGFAAVQFAKTLRKGLRPHRQMNITEGMSRASESLS